MLGAVVALLMLAAVVAVGGSAVPLGEGKPLFGFLRLPVIELKPTITTEPQVVRPGGPDTWVDYLTWAVLSLPLVLLAVAIVSGLVLAVRRSRLRRPSWPSSPDRGPDEEFVPDLPRALLLRAAELARAEFDEHRGEPAHDAVITAWLTLEHAAASSGTRRGAHQTPTEFTEAVLAVSAVDAAAIALPLDTLRRLYHRARFDPAHRTGRPEADAARAALDAIVRGLRAEPVAPVSEPASEQLGTVS